MTAGTFDFTIERGGTLSIPLGLEDDSGDVDFSTTYDLARMQLRPNYLDAPSGTPDAPYIELTSENGRLIMSGTTITISLTAEETSALIFTRAVYDLELVINPGDDEIVDKLLRGVITVDGEATV